MLNAVLYALAGLAVVVAIVLTLAARRPDWFRVERTRHMAAPPDRLFPLINDLKQMNMWNPFALRDPASRTTYSGPVSGPGARFDFDGSKSGSGHIEITGVVPDSRIDMRLVMTKPFKADNVVEFTLAPNEGGTDVTWAMSGRQPLLAKCMAMFIDCDRMVGREFEQGLASLNAIAEVRT